jgi:4-hydroxybenzoate polyprenyltransferase
MPKHSSKFDWSGLWLAIPAIAFLLLYMTAQQFTVLDHVIAFAFVGILAYGTFALQQKQRRRRLNRIAVRSEETQSSDKSR